MIHRYCWPEKYKNSGIGKFSVPYIEALQQKFPIKDIRYSGNPNSLWRIFWQFVVIPLRCLLSPKITKIFYDEGRLPIIFYPISQMIFVIHDVRDSHLTTSHQSLGQKIYFRLIKKTLKKLNTKKVVKIITVSEFTKQKLVRLGINADKIAVINNSFNLWKLLPLWDNAIKIKSDLFSRYHLPKELLHKKILLNVGSEEDRKNIMTILQAMQTLDDYIFIKIGKAIIQSNREKHLNFIQKHHLPVFFLEGFNDEELLHFYQIADVFVFPSLFEGFGRPPVEAQACGLPVISSDKWGLKEVLEDSALILQDPLDAEEIVEKVRLLESDKILKNRIIKLGMKNAQRFSVVGNIGKWDKILK